MMEIIIHIYRIVWENIDYIQLWHWVVSCWLHAQKVMN